MSKHTISSNEEWSDTETNDCLDIEDFTDLTGKCGKWQKILIFLNAYLALFNFLCNINLPFIAPRIDHWCARPLQHNNLSIEDWKNHSIPKEFRNGEFKYSQCEMYEQVDPSAENVTEIRHAVPCSSWEYDHSFYVSTIIDKWDLVCKNSWLVSFVGSAYFSGYFFSSIICGQLSDRFGRKPVLLASVIIELIFGIIAVLVPYYWVYVPCMFLFSVGRTGIFITYFVLVQEVMGIEYRSTHGVFCKIGWGLGHFVLPGIAWLFRDWIYIHLFSFIPHAFTLGLWNFIPESPRWLFCQGRYKEAKILIKKAMNLNKKKVMKFSKAVNMLSCKVQRENQDNNKHYSIIEVLKNDRYRKITFILYFIWIVTTFALYGLTMNAGNIGGSLYLNIVLFGIMELVACFLAHVLLAKMGRQRIMSILLFLYGVLSLITTAIPNNLIWLRISVVVGSKLCQSITSTALLIYTTELYPTVVRNVGFGSCATVARIGAISAPFMKEVGEIVHWILPFIIFGVFSIFIALLTLLLPETKNVHLSNSLST